MKKIISALVLGTMTIGFAAADISVGLNYRNGVELFKYVNTGADGRATDDYGNTYIDSGYDKSGAAYNLFNLTGWNSGKAVCLSRRVATSSACQQQSNRQLQVIVACSTL